MLPSQQHMIIQEAKLTYFLLGKAIEIQIKTIEEQRKKQVQAIQSLDLTTETEYLKHFEAIFSHN